MRDKGVIIDIDGTIADCEHRLRYIEGEKKDWDTFFNLAFRDEPMKKNIKQIKKYCYQNDADPIFITGRRDSYHLRRDTDKWLKVYFDRNAYSYDSKPLFMRDEEDTRPAPEVKKDKVENFIMNLTNS